MTVVCITGMRSGSSMITRLLYICALCLGPEADLMGPEEHDNPLGYWEKLSIYQLNDAILAQLGAAWDKPPVLEQDWWKRPEFDAFREQARQITAELGICQYWGWKDPRNSLTMPFWQDLFPDLKLVICLRHPLEVAYSLHKSNNPKPLEAGLRLWQTHHEHILHWRQSYIVTHYQSYFRDPKMELKRILNFVGLSTSEALIHQAASTISPELYRSDLGELNNNTLLPESIRDIYARFCAEAGPVFNAPT